MNSIENYTYNGKPCCHCSLTLRYQCNGNCVKCSKKHKDYHKPRKQYPYIKEWRKSNWDKVLYYNASRRAKLKANLTREEKEYAQRFYQCAKLLTEITGVVHHVDHIIPLSKGGLHHPKNMQILTKDENYTKHTKILDLV